MQTKVLIGLAITLFYSVFFSTTLWADSAYVRARQAKIYASPSPQADVIATANKGDELVVIQTQGRWVEIKTSNHQGWVSKLLISDQPPMNKVSVLEEQSETLEQNARRRASATTAAAAARGLRSDGRARQSDNDVADFSALREIEQMQISEEEAIEFLEQGVEQ